MLNIVEEGKEEILPKEEDKKILLEDEIAAIESFISEIETTGVVSRHQVVSLEEIICKDIVTRVIPRGAFTKSPTGTNKDKLIKILKENLSQTKQDETNVTYEELLRMINIVYSDFKSLINNLKNSKMRFDNLLSGRRFINKDSDDIENYKVDYLNMSIKQFFVGESVVIAKNLEDNIKLYNLYGEISNLFVEDSSITHEFLDALVLGFPEMNKDDNLYRDITVLDVIKVLENPDKPVKEMIKIANELSDFKRRILIEYNITELAKARYVNYVNRLLDITERRFFTNTPDRISLRIINFLLEVERK